MNPYRKYFFASLLIAAIALGVLVFWPFVTTIVIGIALSVVFHPLYAWFKKKLKYPGLASGATVLTFLLILCIPLFFVGAVVFNQAQDLYAWVVEHGAVNTVVERISVWLSQILPSGTVDIQERLAATVSEIASGAAGMFTATLSTVFTLLIVILIMFYFLKDGPEWKRMLVEMSPLSDKSDEKIIAKLHTAVNGVMRGYLLVGLAQGIAMGFGLFIFGVPNAALWGVFAAIASMVPSIGTALVAAPAIIYLFAIGHDGAAIGMTAWGLLVVGLVDNVLNPIVVGKSVKLHPLLILFSVLGGIALMGATGILIGPLIVSFIYALSSVYKSEMA